jgi:hypothetical protein
MLPSAWKVPYLNEANINIVSVNSEILAKDFELFLASGFDRVFAVLDQEWPR